MERPGYKVDLVFWCINHLSKTVGACVFTQKGADCSVFRRKFSFTRKRHCYKTCLMALHNDRGLCSPISLSLPT